MPTTGTHMPTGQKKKKKKQKKTRRTVAHKMFSMTRVKWAVARENLSSGFPRKQYSNQPAQLQRLARKDH